MDFKLIETILERDKKMAKPLPEQMSFTLFENNNSSNVVAQENMPKAQRRALRIGIKEPSYKRELPLTTQMLILALSSATKYQRNSYQILDQYLQHVPYFIMPSVISEYIGLDAAFYHWNVPSHVDGSQQTSNVRYPDDETLKILNQWNAWNLLNPYVATRLYNNPVPSSPNFRAVRNFNYKNPHYSELLGRMRIEDTYANFVNQLLSSSTRHNHYVVEFSGEVFTRKSFSLQMEALDKIITYYLVRAVRDSFPIKLGDIFSAFWMRTFERLKEVYSDETVKMIHSKIFEKEVKVWELAINPPDPYQAALEIIRIGSEDFRLVSNVQMTTQWKIDKLIYNMAYRLFPTI